MDRDEAPGLELVPADLAACRGIAEVHVQAWRHAYAGIIPAAYLDGLSVDEHEERWRHAVARGSPRLLVARLGEKIQGFIGFDASRDDGAEPQQGEIWVLYVRPEAQRLGVGRRLCREALEALFEEGFTSATLWVIVGNEGATNFYREMGFQVEPGSRQSFMVGAAQLGEERLHIPL
ncbi:N-acetyltransferase family protein [Halomonas sp. A29]|uniref:GNAT family N-acetyltransferase n=1 Tax=Halomonas sp. A29 TaxID=3102786 RepID=UPI00398ABECB